MLRKTRRKCRYDYTEAIESVIDLPQKKMKDCALTCVPNNWASGACIYGALTPFRSLFPSLSTPIDKWEK